MGQRKVKQGRYGRIGSSVMNREDSPLTLEGKDERVGVPGRRSKVDTV